MSDSAKSTIYIVDDDSSVRQALDMLFCSAGFIVETFASAKEFLVANFREQNACLIADVRMPGISGLELHRQLNASGSQIPVIFITGFDTEEARSQAKKSGAVAYLRKPVDDQALLDAIWWALSRHAAEDGMIVST